MTQQEITDQLVLFLRKEISGFAENRPLIQQIDSLQILSLVATLEETFHVQISSMELTGESFHSVESLARLLANKLKR